MFDAYLGSLGAAGLGTRMPNGRPSSAADRSRGNNGSSKTHASALYDVAVCIRVKLLTRVKMTPQVGRWLLHASRPNPANYHNSTVVAAVTGSWGSQHQMDTQLQQ